MKTNIILDDQERSGNGLVISKKIAANLKETRRWMFYIAILAFVLILYFVIEAFREGIYQRDVIGRREESSFIPVIIVIIQLLIVSIFAVPYIYLLMFSRKIKTAVVLEESQEVTESFRYLRSHFRWQGVAFFIVIGLYLIAFITFILLDLLKNMH